MKLEKKIREIMSPTNLLGIAGSKGQSKILELKQDVLEAIKQHKSEKKRKKQPRIIKIKAGTKMYGYKETEKLFSIHKEDQEIMKAFNKAMDAGIRLKDIVLTVGGFDKFVTEEKRHELTIESVIKWMNTYDTLKDTHIPIRFKEYFTEPKKESSHKVPVIIRPSKEYNMPVTLSELKGHYKVHFMSADDFIELVKSYTKRRVDKKLADIDIWTKTYIAIHNALKPRFNYDDNFDCRCHHTELIRINTFRDTKDGKTELFTFYYKCKECDLIMQR